MVKVSNNLYLFSQCFRTSHSCFQIKSSDNNCDGVSEKLKYLNLYDHISDPMVFIITLEHRHFGSRESISATQQNSQTFKEAEVDTSIFVVFYVLC